MNYWTGVEYLGFGPAAHSFYNSERTWNVRSLHGYMKACAVGKQPREGRESLDRHTVINELLLTRLRLTQGLVLDEFEVLAGWRLEDNQTAVLRKWNSELIIENKHLRLTQLGWPLLDEITSDLMVTSV